jgi:hypothetical protein
MALSISTKPGLLPKASISNMGLTSLKLFPLLSNRLQ